AQGGWDVTYVFDPKLGVPGIEGPEFLADPTNADDVDYVATFGDLRVTLNDLRRPSATRFFQEQVARTAIVNGIWVGSIAHDPCRVRMLTGTTLQTNADVVTISGKVYGESLPLGSVDMSGVGFTGALAATAGSIGGSSQIKTLLDPNVAFTGPGNGLQYPLYVPSAADEDRVRRQLSARHTALSGRLPQGGAIEPRWLDFLESMDRSKRLVDQASGIVGQLELGSQPSFRLMLDLATDLLSESVCASVLVDTRMQWDTHVNNSEQNEHFETMFSGLNDLAQMLDDKGLADSTSVVVMSEMTRTPKHNPDRGKDHWQHTSAMLFGANVRPGLYGATDDLLESIPMDLATGEPSASAGDLCKYESFVAGILAMLDVDPAEWFPDAVPFLGAKA
ncbi:MAG: DUF1501 domain-containing protein, partial [Myxococcota bacterium]